MDGLKSPAFFCELPVYATSTGEFMLLLWSKSFCNWNEAEECNWILRRIKLSIKLFASVHIAVEERNTRSKVTSSAKPVERNEAYRACAIWNRLSSVHEVGANQDCPKGHQRAAKKNAATRKLKNITRWAWLVARLDVIQWQRKKHVK